MNDSSDSPKSTPAPSHPAALSSTLAVVNARVWTGDARRPWADAIAVRNDTIVAVGSTAEVRKLTGAATRVIDAAGQMVVPGFIDSHVHFVDGGFRLASVQLRDAKTPSDFIARIKAFAAKVPPGAWITGGDWDHEQWGGELPRREWIDSVTPNHPVWVNRLDGHMALANGAALRAAGVTAATAEIAGGTVVRSAGGEPTGVLKDNAMSLMDRAVPEPGPELQDRALDAAMRYVSEQGVTSVHNMGSWSDLAAFERARAAGRLRTRIYAAVPLATWERLRDTVNARGRGDDWLRIGALKGFVDGSLGSHTAAMLEPFTDAPRDTGLLVNAPEDLYAWTSGADKAGLHVMVHAIGDRANRMQLDIFERVARENGARDRRFRIEHAQHLAPADIPRFGALGVIPSMQPYHAIDDGRWAEKVIGPERAKGTYAFRSLIDGGGLQRRDGGGGAPGARLAFGSDWFVAPPTPLEGIYAAVTRRTLDGKRPDGWIPAEGIGVEDALRAYTTGGAYASFEEGKKGTLERGKLADFVIIDRDITRVPREKLRDARIVMTVVGGKPVYERPGALGHQAPAAVKQALSLARDGAVRSLPGSLIRCARPNELPRTFHCRRSQMLSAARGILRPSIVSILALPVLLSAARPIGQSPRADSLAVPGFTFTFKVTMDRQGSGSEMTGKAQVAGGNARFAIESGKSPSPMLGSDGYILVRGADNSMIMVDPEKKQYFEMNMDALNGMLGAVSAFVKIDVTDVKTELEKLGGGEAILGRPTQRSRVTQSYNMNMSVMGKKETTSIKTVTEMWAASGVERMTNPFTEMASSVGQMLGNGRGVQELQKQTRGVYQKLDGMPLKSVVVSTTANSDGKTETHKVSSEVTSFKEGDVPASVFKVPEGYERTDPFAGMQGIGAKLDSAAMHDTTAKRDSASGESGQVEVKDAVKDAAKDAAKEGAKDKAKKKLRGLFGKP